MQKIFKKLNNLLSSKIVKENVNSAAGNKNYAAEQADLKAKQFLDSKDYERAIIYFQEAITLELDTEGIHRDYQSMLNTIAGKLGMRIRYAKYKKIRKK